MDIRSIRTFVKVAELKSFTKAAEKMNYVQSTVTMQIQQLEKELGYPLFDRIGKRISLTSLGQEFLIYAYEILNVVERAENVGRNTENIRGTLRVGVTESLMFGVLLELLPTFKEKFRYLDLSLKTGHMTELLEELKQNRLDMVYVSASLNTDPDLCCYYTHKEHMVFLCGPGHSLATQRNIPLQDLLSYEFLVTEREGICYGRLRELVARYNAVLKASVELDSVFVITELVKRGMGLAFLPEYAVQRQLEEGTLVKPDVNIEPQTYYSQILCHKSRWISPFMDGLIRMIKEVRPEEE